MHSEITIGVRIFYHNTSTYDYSELRLRLTRGAFAHEGIPSSFLLVGVRVGDALRLCSLSLLRDGACSLPRVLDEHTMHIFAFYLNEEVHV